MKNKTFKGFWKTIVMMTLGAIVGILLSFLLNSNFISVEESLYNFQNLLVNNAFRIYYFILTISIVLTLIFYNLGKKQMMDSIRDDDGVTKDSMMSVAMMIPNIGLYSMLAMFGLIIKRMSEVRDLSAYLLVFTLVSYIAFILFYAIMQNKTVEKIKELYPEKKGNVYNLNFQKEWEKSLDEREKVVLYYTGYKSYKLIEKVLLVLLLISLMLVDVGGISLGVYPPITIGMIIVISNIGYLYYSIKSDNLV